MSWSNRSSEILKLSAILLWLAFTVVFALWWFDFGLSNIALLASLEPEKLEHWERQRRMIFWEGLSWIVLLILGGGALIALVQKERWRVRRIKEFFASFSHEIKTSLASLRLQAESLKDDKIESPILDRLISDTVRLQLQLENSLFLASQEGLHLYMQPIALHAMIDAIREQWPGLTIHFTQKCTVLADERALYTILSNFLQNAIVHGGAKNVTLSAETLDANRSRVAVTVRDDGKGFDGECRKLGQLFYRPKSTSGSGLGIYICRMLLNKMNGDLVLLERSESASGNAYESSSGSSSGSTSRNVTGFGLKVFLVGDLQ